GDDEEESSEDDEDDDMDIEVDEEEDHPAPADSIVVASTAADQAPSAEETGPFETDESTATPPPYPAYRITARISIPAPLLAGRLNMLFRDRRAHAYTRQLMETKARMSRETWVRATDASDLVHGEVMSLRTTVLGQMSEIRELQAADRRRQTVQTVGHEAAYDMSWKTLMKIMTNKYCPRNEIRKLEMELWELKVMGTDLASYTQCFKELALLCGRMFSEESDRVEKYVGCLPDMIHESVVASKPKTMQEAIEIVTELMDKKIRTFAERETASKRKFKNTSRTTRNQ
nr:hypothetical protein [Tanacetum cinerariifolium]